MLTEKEYKEILKYHKAIGRAVIRGRKACQRVPADPYTKTGVNRLEGRLRAIRHICEILEISLPETQDIIV